MFYKVKIKYKKTKTKNGIATISEKEKDIEDFGEDILYALESIDLMCIDDFKRQYKSSFLIDCENAARELQSYLNYTNVDMKFEVNV